MFQQVFGYIENLFAKICLNDIECNLFDNLT